MASTSVNNDKLGLVTAGVCVAATALVGAVAYRKSQRTKNSHDCCDQDAAAASSKKKNVAVESWESHVVKHTPLQELWPNTLWRLEAAGADRGPPVRNMCIYRVPDKSQRLVIFNGIAVDDATISQIESLGKPAILIVPNYLHKCCAAVWKQRYPDMLVVCPAIAQVTVCKVLKVDQTIDEWAAMPEWSPWIVSKTIDGWDDFEHVMEFQLERSKTGKKAVLVCDLLFTVPYKESAGILERCLVNLFDSSITLPLKGHVIVPKVARLSRIFAIQDWNKAEEWYRTYAREHGKSVAVMVVGHGEPVQEVDAKVGCTDAFEGVADQLTKPRW
jgi:hypothetical protein